MTDRELLAKALQNRLKQEEDNLDSLGCPRDAWKVLRVRWNDLWGAHKMWAQLRYSNGKGKGWPYKERYVSAVGNGLGVWFIYRPEWAHILLGPDVQELPQNLWRDPKQRQTVTTPKWLAAQSAAVAAAALKLLDHVGVQHIAATALEHFRSLRATPVRDALRGHRAQCKSSQGGKAPKRLPGIWQRVLKALEADSKVTTSAVFNSFPDSREAEGESEVLIYRDGNDLVEVDDATGKPRSITYDTLRGYLKIARKGTVVSSK